MANSVVWIDIPVLDMDRALRFYSAVLGTEIQRFNSEAGELGFLPGEGVGGCFYVTDKVQPTPEGTLVYLNCQDRLDEAEAAIAPAGGTILTPKEKIGPHGFRVVFLDTEGNRFALHSM